MKNKIAFGAGKYFIKNWYTKIKDENIIAVIDNDKSKQGSDMFGIPVISLEDLSKYPDSDILITTERKCDIILQLMNTPLWGGVISTG